MTIPKKRLRSGVERFRRRFGDQPTRAIKAVLPAKLAERVMREELGRHRERVYPPMTTLALFIGPALSRDRAGQDAVARNLAERTAQGEPTCSLSSGPYCKARQRLPLKLIERLAVAVGDALEAASLTDWKWRGRTVKLVDGATISMRDTPMRRRYHHPTPP